MKNVSKWVAALAVVVLLAGTAAAADGYATGKIKAINAGKKTFVLTADGGKDHSFTLGDNLVINRADKEGKFSELKEGDHVSVLYKKGVVSNTAEYVLVHEGDNKNAGLAGGAIKSWDEKTGKLTVTGYDSKNYTFEVKNDSKIELAGKPAKIDDLKQGEQAIIVYTGSADKPVVKQLMVEKK
jgi:hypothetical protein